MTTAGTHDAATEAHIGHGAAAPHQIPLRGWWHVALRTAKNFSKNEILAEAAGITFYALLSLVPAITALVSIYGLFTDPATIKDHLHYVSTVMPSGGMEIVRDQVQRLIKSPRDGLSFGAIFGVLSALWSANQGTKAMFSSLTDVYEGRDDRGFIRLTAMTLLFTIGGIVVLLVGLGAIVVLPFAFDWLGLHRTFDVVLGILRWPLVFVAITMALALLYRYGPYRPPVRWRWVTWGGAIATISWIGLSVGFSWYVSHFGSFNKTYGSLGAIVGFMIWIWLSSSVVLIGAQINAEIEAQAELDPQASSGE